MNHEKTSIQPNLPTAHNNSIHSDSNSVQSDDFVFRMISTKDQYIVGEKVELYAELEYVGQHPEITITHAASPIGISLHENNSNIGYKELYNQLAEGNFPKGEYVMTAKANFNDITSAQKEEYEMQVSSSFTVVE